MSFFTKLFTFLKNSHPIRNFAKPIPKQNIVLSTSISSQFAHVPISYEALKAELLETPQVSEYHPTYEDTAPAFQAFETARSTSSGQVEEQQEREINGEEEISAPVVVIRKLEVRPEESLVLASDIEERLAPDTVISEIVDLTPYQTQSEPEVVAEIPEESAIDLVLVESVIETETPVSEKASKKSRSSKKSEPTAKAATPKAKSAKKPTKTARSTSSGQVVKSKSLVKPKKAVKKVTSVKNASVKSRRKAPTPREAMGFGF